MSHSISNLFINIIDTFLRSISLGNISYHLNTFLIDIQKIQIHNQQIQSNSPTEQLKQQSAQQLIHSIKDIKFDGSFGRSKNNQNIIHQPQQPIQNTQINHEFQENEFMGKQIQQYANQIISSKQQEKQLQNSFYTFNLFQLLKIAKNKFQIKQQHALYQFSLGINSMYIQNQEEINHSHQQSNKIKQIKKQIIEEKTKEFIEAQLKQFEIKKQFIMKMIKVVQRTNQQSIQYTFNAFKVGEENYDRSEKNIESNKGLSISSKKKSQQSQDFNLDLTIKSKNSKNLFSLIKQDSLMYSNASQFAPNIQRSLQSPQKKVQNPKQKHSASNKTVLRKIEDQGDLSEQPGSLVLLNKSQSKQILFNIQQDEQKIVEYQNNNKKNKINQNLQFDMQQSINQNDIPNTAKFNLQQQRPTRKRVDTQVERPRKKILNSRNSYKKEIKIDNSRVSIQSSNTNIFATQINTYQNKIVRIRQEKQMKKKKLQQELQKVNMQIQTLRKKQENSTLQNLPNANINRFQIADNHSALIKAQSLVRNLRIDKKHRVMVKLSQFKSLDKNINDYMQQLAKMRLQNQNKLKQKKKLQILDRMKQKEIEKANDKKKKQQTIKFVHLLRVNQSEKKSPRKKTDKTEKIEKTENKIELTPTPQLIHKKAYLNQIRNFTIKKQSVDIYEQALS